MKKPIALFGICSVFLILSLIISCAGAGMDTSDLESLEETPSASPAPVEETPAPEVETEAEKAAKARAAASRAIGAELSNLAPESVTFNPPAEMGVNTKQEVEVSISKTVADDLTKKINDKGVGGGNVTVKPTIKAKLSGKNFEINPLSPEEQALGGDADPKWKFEVTPKEKGDQKLSVAVTLEANSPDVGNVARTATVADKPVTVTDKPALTAATFVQNYLLWILGIIILIGVAGWVGYEIYMQDKASKKT